MIRQVVTTYPYGTATPKQVPLYGILTSSSVPRIVKSYDTERMIRLKKRMAAALIVFLILMESCAFALTIQDLPKAVDWSRSVNAPSFSMTGIGGVPITSAKDGAGHSLLLVYGRILCWNTRAFLSGIQPAMDLLKESGVTVLVGLHDDPTDAEMQEFLEDFPGVVCGKVSNYYAESGMWTGLEAWNGSPASYLTFPAVFLRDPSGHLRYCSTGYVDMPLTVAAGAIAMANTLQMARDMADVILPNDLTVIQSEAFRKDTFTSVWLGESVTDIDSYAFAENPSLKWIYIPASVKNISATAFSGCSGLKILGTAGSMAQAFADEMGFLFIAR